MDGMIYVSTSGAYQMLKAQTVYANNLANANTTGFKADRIGFNTSPVKDNLGSTRIYSVLQSLPADLSPGALQPTDRPMDIAVNGDGWIAVQDPAGKEAYTRSGSLRINQDGLLITLDNLPVLGTGGQMIIPPFQKMDIAIDGTVTIVPKEGENPQPMVLDRIKLVKPDNANLQKSHDGLIRTKDQQAQEPDSSVLLTTGFLESSNVNAVEALTSMISLARQYELQVKMMSIAQDNEKANTSILGAA